MENDVLKRLSALEQEDKERTAAVARAFAAILRVLGTDGNGVKTLEAFKEEFTARRPLGLRDEDLLLLISDAHAKQPKLAP